MYYANKYRESNQDEKPEKVIKAPKKYKFKKEATGEAVLFKQLVATRPHRSFISGVKINEFYSYSFLHVIPKAQNKYPNFKLYAKNIVFGTKEEHDLWDKGLKSELKKKPEWDKMFKLEAELIDEYKELNKQLVVK